MPSSQFRLDINGLRAWAVVAVVLFHFDVPGFSGGFVGVDIFFVISGFLMTQIIVNALEVGRFSLWSFYLARAKRIIPALLVLCLTLLVLGWCVLPATDYRALGEQALASLLFFSNIQYWHEAGYFDIDAREKWLLHTWSLSVEWQFYLLLPLALMALWRYWPGRLNALQMATLGLLASLLYSVYLTGFEPETAFYWPPARAWEMLSGALAALCLQTRIAHTLSRHEHALQALGFAMMALSVATADASAWPGVQAILPTLGAALVLLAGVENSLLTAPAVWQRLGDWSYSIYLWHWPVAVALYYLDKQAQAPWVASGLALSLLLGWASYRWTEPLGRKHLAGWSTWPALSAMAAAVALAALPALVAGSWQDAWGGMPGKRHRQQIGDAQSIASAAKDFDPRRDECHNDVTHNAVTHEDSQFKRCIYGGPDIRIIVLGDSHANASVTAVQAALPLASQGVLAMSQNSCPTIFGVQTKNSGYRCALFNEWAMTQMAILPATVPVIIINRSSFYPFGNDADSNTPAPVIYFEGEKSLPENEQFLQEYARRLTASACRIAQSRPVYLLRPIPEMPADVPRTMARAALWGRPLNMAMPLATYHKRHALVWAAQDKARAECGVHILDPLPYLCATGVCPAMDGKVPRYRDTDHLSEAGNKRLVEMFRAVVGSH